VLGFPSPSLGCALASELFDCCFWDLVFLLDIKKAAGTIAAIAIATTERMSK
jgi:hypothetical protein